MTCFSPARGSALTPLGELQSESLVMLAALATLLGAARSGADWYGSPLVAVTLDPDSTLSPMTTWCQLGVGGRRRVGSSRRWRGRIVARRRRWGVGDSAPDDRARG